MSRFHYSKSRHTLAMQLIGFWILIGSAGNVLNPCIHLYFPLRHGWRSRLLKIVFRTSITRETTLHIRYGQKIVDFYDKQPRTAWRIDLDSDHYAIWVMNIADKHPLLAQYKVLWDDEHGSEVETRLLGVKNRHMFL